MNYEEKVLFYFSVNTSCLEFIMIVLAIVSKYMFNTNKYELDVIVIYKVPRAKLLSTTSIYRKSISKIRNFTAAATLKNDKIHHQYLKGCPYSYLVTPRRRTYYLQSTIPCRRRERNPHSILECAL